MKFNIIRFKPSNLWYYPASIELGILAESRNYTKHTDVEIPIGKSRVGGPIVDLPGNINYPKNLFFVAQLNLADFTAFDKNQLLPKSGFLYFFTDNYFETGKVLYEDCDEKDLVRVIKEHDQPFWDGSLIDEISSETESFAERYNTEYIDDNNLSGWDDFAGSEKSKVYGIFTHCQWEEDEIKKITDSDDVLLLQIGEDFTEEGVFSVRININNLKNRNFEICKFDWGQS